MTRTIIAGVAAFMAVLTINAGADSVVQHHKSGLRGASGYSLTSRRASETDKKSPKTYCNSIGCPDNYIPVDGAHNVECKGGECDMNHCCQAMCAGFPCDDGYTPISAAAETLCAAEGCSLKQCCEKLIQRKADNCGDYRCLTGYTSVDDAERKECRLRDESRSDFYGDDASGTVFSFFFGSIDFIDDGWWSSMDGGKNNGGQDEEGYCNMSTCCRKLERGLWGAE